MDILEEIIAYKHIEVERCKQEMTERAIHHAVEQIVERPVASLHKAISESENGIIAEFKRRSPSKGWINEDANVAEVTPGYQQVGAAAISILTDRKYFGGDDSFITETRRAGVSIPVLYKNFIIDEYQLFQARLCGASAVLLIAAALSLPTCRSLLAMSHELGLEVLLELHCERELDYVEFEPDVCGVNNRNLGTFVTDVRNSFNMASRLPDNVCKVSESGISNPETINGLRLAGFNGFLIGETFMKSEAPAKALKEFIGKL